MCTIDCGFKLCFFVKIVGSNFENICCHWIYFDRAVCLFEQKSSDVTASVDEDGSSRGFTASVMLPKDQGLLCITADQQFLVYLPVKQSKGVLELNLRKRLVGYNEEIVDIKFLGDEEQFLAVATNIEQVFI